MSRTATPLPSRHELHLQLVVCSYRKQQMYRVAKEVGFVGALIIATVIASACYPSSVASLILKVVSFLAGALDLIVVTRRIEIHRTNGEEHERQVERVILRRGGKWILAPDEEDQLRRGLPYPNLTIQQWFENVNAIPKAIRPAVLIAQASAWRAADHYASRSLAFVILTTACVIPFLVAFVVQLNPYGVAEAVTSFSGVYSATLAVAWRNHRAGETFDNIDRAARALVNAHIRALKHDCEPAPIAAETDHLFAELSQARRSYSPVCKTVYKMMRTRNNRRMVYLIRRIKAFLPV